MAIRTIREEGDPVLRKQSRIVDAVDDKIRVIIDDMVETMYEADGVGLAAPQIGILKRIIVVDIYDETGVKVLVNPEILETSGEQTGVEGCLSVPGESGEVSRPNYVKIKGLGRNGEEVVYEGKGLLARAFCHEVDHLNGILFIDKVIDEGGK
ncbi:MAG: peptide deformylase [Clostridia bacterium]|nr:peptide deformylase [Clostridia bacterium]